MKVKFGVSRSQSLDPNRPLAVGEDIRLPAYDEVAPRNPTVTYSAPEGEVEWYPPVMVGAETVARRITSSSLYVEETRRLLTLLEPDDYTSYLLGLYQAGVERLGSDWEYADIVTVLMGLADMLAPRNYLEIGVRRGRSVCAVASRTPMANLVMFDMWIENYAGMENPGQAFVDGELDKVGHKGSRTYVNGNSHETVQRYMRDNPDVWFDLITVDGDHSTKGAIDDLCDVLPRLTVGGAVVFDDICHPAHPGLSDVWQRVVCDDRRFAARSFNEIGYGVGFAVRKW